MRCWLRASFAAGLLLCLAAGPLGASAQAAREPVLAAATAKPANELPTTLNARQADNVAALGQVWGLLKYHHSAVAAGQRDWDAEFLRLLPAVLACSSAAERSRLLAGWVAGLGTGPACAPCPAPPTAPVRLLPDFGWLQDNQRFSKPLQQLLRAVVANRYQGPGYYVSRKGSTTVFEHEEAYADQACPPVGLRLLGLCRYWNMLQYYYPYHYAIGEDWARVLPSLLPRFAAAATPLAYRHAALALFTRVHDGHARFYQPDPLLEAERGAYQVAADVQFIDEQAVVVHVRDAAPANPALLLPGDVITHVAGTAVARLVQQRLPETPGSNRAAQLNTIALKLLCSPAPQLAVQVRRAGQALPLALPAGPVGAAAIAPAAADSMYRFLTPDVGYIDMARIKGAKLALIMQTFARTKGIVVDQRNYPGEFVATYFPQFLLARPVAFARFTRYDATCPGRFLWEPADTIKPLSTKPYTGRVVVLVNEVSRSQAEFAAMAVQATPHGTLLGSQTAGADGNASAITLPGGLRTLMTGIGAYYPDGRETQRVGLRLDVPVRPTVAGIRAGRDELRDRAVELIENGPASAN